MKRSIILATAFTLSSSIVGYSAEPNVAPSAPRTSNVRAVQGGGIMRSGIVGTNQTQAERDIEQHEKVVKLTDAQKQRIKDIYDKRDQELREYQVSITEKMQKQQAAMNEAVQSKDQAKIETARKQWMALFTPQQEIVKRGQESLKKVFTPEQKEKIQDAKFMNTIAQYAPGVELTPGQINLLRIASTTGDGELEGYEGVLYELLNKTLTADQAKTALKFRVNQMLESQFRNAGITPEQQKKIDARITLMLEHHPRAMHVDGVVFQKIREYVNEILTAEQKETMKFPRAS